MADNERDAKLVLRAEDRATKTFEQVRKSVADLKTALTEQAAAAERGEGSIEGLNKTLKQIQQTADDLNKQKSALLAFEKAGDSATKAAERVTKATTAFETFRDKLAGTETVTDAQTTRLGRLAESVTRAQSSLDAANGRIDSAKTKLTAFGLSTEGVTTQIDHINRTFGELPPLLTRATVAVEGFGAAQVRAAAAATASNRTTTFTQVGTDAVAAASDLSRFAGVTDNTTAHLVRLADAVREIVSPTLASVQSLTGALDTVDKAGAIAGSNQKKRVSEYQDALNQLTQAQAALVRQAGNIDVYQRQDVALQHLEVDLGVAATKVRTLGEAIARVPSDAEKLNIELRVARNELERIGAETQTARTKFQQLGEQLRTAGVDTTNLNGTITRLTEGSRRSAETADVLRTRLGGGANGGGFLGLKPYELQNLSFQVNDVFTSLASGISPLQTLAQQGGQITQLFPGVVSGFVKLLPVLLPVGVALGIVAAGLAETYKQAAAARQFNAQLLESANSARYTAGALADAQIQFERLDVSSKDAATAIRGFVTQGFDPSGLDDFLKVVKSIADATGLSIPEAAEKYRAALSKGYDAVATLNDVTGALSNSQLQQVKDLYDVGKATEAVALVTGVYQGKAQQVSDSARSEWSSSFLRLTNAFYDLIKQFNAAPAAAGQLRGVFGELIGIVDKFTDGLKLAREALVQVTRGQARAQAAGATNFGLTGDYSKQLKANYVAAGLDENGDAITAKPAKPSKRDTSSPRTREQQTFLDQQQTELQGAKLLTAQERLRNAEMVARRKAENVGLRGNELEQAAVNARKIEQQKIDQENATKGRQAAAAQRKEESAAAKAAREAETRLNQINALTLDLRNTYLSFSDNQDPFQTITNKAAEAVNKVRDQFAKLGKLGVFKVDGKTLGDYEAIIRKNADILTQKATQKKQEDDINALLAERTQRLAAIQDSVKRGEISPTQGVEQSQAVVDALQPKITALTTTALAFNTALRTATYDPKLEEFIAKLQRDLADAAGKNEIKTVLDSALKDAQQNLAALVSTRDEYVKTQNALVTAGLKTDIDAQKAIQTEYANTRVPILAAADAVQAVIDKMVALKLISPEAAAALTGSLQLARAGTKQLTADQVALAKAAEQALAGSIGDFIESLGTQIANVIDGTSSLKDALQGIASAALNFAASFTKAIAQAIIQLLALKIARAALSAVGISGFHDGGVIGSGQPTFSRRVPSEVFAGAARYHSGGVAGLLPDEVPAILQKGEEVITANDPRHRSNGGTASGAPTPVNIKNVNLFDAGEAVSAGANTRVGEQAILNVIRSNPSAVREAIGNGA